MYLTYLIGSLRAAYIINVLNIKLNNQLDRFFNFPVSLNFCLYFSRRYNNAIKKIINVGNGVLTAP